MSRNVIGALGLIGLGLLSGCPGGGNTALTTVPTAHLAITLPATTVAAGTPFTFTVTAVDATNAVVPTYIGTVHITTSDASATLPSDATLARGVGSFTVTFNTTGSHTITASDTVGDATSGTSPAVSVSPIPAPTVTSISPTNAFAGDVGFTLTLNGSNLVPSSVVQWNGSNRPTVFGSSSQVTAQISAADIAIAGTAAVTVLTPAGSSNTATFTITPCGAVAPQSLAIDPTGKFAYVAGTVCPKLFDGYVSMYTINPTTGALTSIGPSVPTQDAGARFVTVDPSGKFVYVANWGEGDLPGSVSMFTIDASTGALTFNGTASAPCGSGPGACAPWAVAVHPSGKFAYVANEGGFAPTSVSMYAIASAGGLSLLGTIAAGDRANSVTVDPTGKFAYVTNSYGNSGSNDVSMFSIDSSSGVLTSIGAIAAGTDPVAVVVDPAGKFAYVTSNDILMYAINGTTGVLTPAQTVAGGPATSIVIHPSGKFAYIPTSGSNNVSIYNIDAATGALTLAETEGSASIAAIHPSGKFAYGFVTNSVGSVISIYSIDAATGALTLIGTIGT
jgi:DNA-binding beta-propeller fold protein YncE